MAVYHAFPYGKMNQCVRMENERNEVLYEANLVKFRLFTASDFEFINGQTKASAMHKVGKTKSVEEGTLGINMTSASYFKLDGKNCYKIMEEKGFTFKIQAKLDILHPEFAMLDRGGNTVAVYKMNVMSAKEEGVKAIGGKQSNIQVTTDSTDLETVFFGAFILSRVDFSLYLV